MKYFDSKDIRALFDWIVKDKTELFETEFARYIGTKYAIGTSFGRTALYLGLKAIDADKGEVIVPAFICTVVRHAVEMAGAVPRFVDVNPDTFELDMNDLRRKITAKTKAVILTHYFGRVARNMKEVIEFVKNRDIILIEDCAHTLGAECWGKKVGTFGNFSIFSLTKNMINFGGGILVTDDEQIHGKARAILKQNGKSVGARISNFPIVFAYGLEQAIGKLMLDRIGHQKWWLLHIPLLLVRLRRYLLTAIRFPKKIIKLGRKNRSGTMNAGHQRSSYEYDLAMEPLIASMGRSQLRKTDSLTAKRRKVYDALNDRLNFHANADDNIRATDVFTHLVLTFGDNDILQIIEQCKKEGLSLRGTWPTRQRLWEDQDTENVLKIKKENAIWTVNPDLNGKEIARFADIVNNIRINMHTSKVMKSRNHMNTVAIQSRKA